MIWRGALGWTSLTLGTVAFAAAAIATGCTASSGDEESGSSEDTTSNASATGPGVGGGGNGSGGMGTGADTGSCEEDCSAITTPDCQVAECNEGMHPGPIGQCVVVPGNDGASCDDGMFCTLGDSCRDGMCIGGEGVNDCGLQPGPCQAITCNDMIDDCEFGPADDGSACLPNGLCEVNGACIAGMCVGTPKDCLFDALAECNSMTCNAMTGDCDAMPNAALNGQPCELTGTLCNDGKTCSNGACLGGAPKDCSQFTAGCETGMCNPVSGLCFGMPGMMGDPCADGTDQCNDGICDGMNNCVPTPVMNGIPCTDPNICTTGDTCQAGACTGGTVDPNCYYEGFDGGCPAGWTLGGDWQCGVQTTSGPMSAFSGTMCLGTVINGLYNNNQSFAVTTADSPPIMLTTATPQMTFQVWNNTEGFGFDGFNLQISTDNGMTFNAVSSVTPAYNDTIGGQAAWSGDDSMLDWQLYNADLTAFNGMTVILRFAFESDTSVTLPGVYIDDVTVL